MGVTPVLTPSPGVPGSDADGLSLAESSGRVRLEPSWKQRVGDWLLRPEMLELSAFLRQRAQAGARIFPPGPKIFAALDATPFDEVKVVILGQDPYHGAGQAHGLCFSVLPGVPVPPSLDNIFKEIGSDLGIARPDHGCLLPWARRGVLLLNSVLTVEEGCPGSHQRKGWEDFTDHVVETLASQRAPVRFVDSRGCIPSSRSRSAGR